MELSDGGVFSGSLIEDLKIDQHNIDRELADHPSRAAWFGALAELASVESDRLYEEWKDATASAEINLRDRAVSNNQKPPSEKTLEARARMDPTVQAAREAYFRAREALAQLRNGQRAFDHRRDALIALAKRLTSEFSGSILNVKQEFSETPEEARDRRVAAASKPRSRRVPQ